jgi:hypothetical protein
MNFAYSIADFIYVIPSIVEESLPVITATAGLMSDPGRIY